MAKALTIIDAIEDENLFQKFFPNHDDWVGWRAFLRSTFGLKLPPDELKIFQECTGRTRPLEQQATEAHLIIGRRGGKSQMLALIATYLACFVDWRPNLSPGERATIMVIAADRRQARIIFRYIEAFIKETPLLSSLLIRDTAEIFELKKQVSIEIHTASFRGLRGYSIPAALCDEIAFWRSDDHSQNPDTEIINALRPGMITMPNSMLLCASSPYARRGVLWQAYDRYYGEEGSNRLVWKAPTWVMHPKIDSDFIKEEYEKDPSKAAAEYGAEFRTDVETYLPREVIEACTDDTTFERAFLSENEYVAFVDPSGGSKDSFTLSIAHKEEEDIVVDLVRESIPPFSPEDIVKEYCHVLRDYGISSVVGDRYGGEWPRERFREHGVMYEISKFVKSELYKNALPLFNSKKVRLLDNEKMLLQFCQLERRTSSAGRDIIDHPPGGYDDVANAVAGAMNVAYDIAPLEFW
jgi:hypothetical protein